MLRFTVGMCICLAGASCDRSLTKESSDPAKKGSAAKNEQSKKSTGADQGAVLAAENYIRADYRNRYLHVHDGSKLKDEMTAFYSAIPPWSEVEKIEFDQVNRVRDDRAIVAFTERLKRGDFRNRCYLRKFNGKWLVDWPATVGINAVSFKAFRASPPSGVTIFRSNAELSNYFNYQYLGAKSTHYSISLGDRFSTDRIYGFVEKDSKLGSDFFRLLKDGRQHEITVAVQASGDGGVAEITGLVSETWFLD